MEWVGIPAGRPWDWGVVTVVFLKQRQFWGDARRAPRGRHLVAVIFFSLTNQFLGGVRRAPRARSLEGEIELFANSCRTRLIFFF